MKFYVDESTAIVDFQTYHKREEDIYPTFSFCISSDNPKIPWYQSNLPHYNVSILKEKYNLNTTDKQRDYVRFLLGNETDPNTVIGIDEILKVNYDEATIDLRHYLKTVRVESGGRVLYEWPTNNNAPNPLYISYRHGLSKCFSLDISEEIMPNITEKPLNVIIFEFFTDNNVFDSSSEIDMGWYMHYPKQLIRSTNLEYDNLGITSRVEMKLFVVDNLEVIRRRNARLSTCIEEYKEDDDLMRRKLIEKTGCSPPHWPLEDDYSRCTTIKQMSGLRTPSLRFFDSEYLKQFDPPCSQVQTVAYTYKDLAPPSGPPPESAGPPSDPPTGPPERPTKGVAIIYKNPNYKQIELVQSFTVESLVGNIGGYVGLFLGCAFWQAPDFIFFLLNKLNRIVKTLLGSTKDRHPIISVQRMEKN